MSNESVLGPGETPDPGAPTQNTGDGSIVAREPVLVAVTTFVGATIALLVAFGIEFTAAQSGAMIGWVAAAYGVGLLIRKAVTPKNRARDDSGRQLAPVTAGGDPWADPDPAL